MPDGWTTVRLKAASLNHSDLWAMRGGPVSRPVVLGSDGAGTTDDGREVIIHPILRGTPHVDPMHDPGLRMLSQGVDGTFATRVAVPEENLVAKPPGLSWEAAACLGTAWLTAYRMLFGAADLKPGETVLVQVAGGGVSTALIRLASSAGLRVWVTSRDAARGGRAVRELGATAAFHPGEPLPAPVDAALDTVGSATFRASLRAVRPGGRVVVAGATTGTQTRVDLGDLFLRSVSVIGSAMGSPTELARLAHLCANTPITPAVDSVWPLSQGRAAITRMLTGDAFGKIVLTCDES